MVKLNNTKLVPILAGPLGFLILELLGAPSTMNPEAYQVLCVTLWVAIWWVFEAIPIAVTALLPIILFPLTGAMDISETATSFGHK